MKKFLALFAVVLMLASLTPEADAAMRFGGGRSFGRSTSSLFQKAPPAKPAMAGKTAPGASQAAPNAARPGAAQQTAKTGTAAAAATSRPMGGMFMGIAAALGLTALMSALGLSAEFAQFLVALLGAFLIFYAIRFVVGLFVLKRVRESAQNTYAQAQASQSYGASKTASVYEAGQSRPGSVMDSFSTEAGLESLTVPAGFDAKGFEAVARDNFIRLQKAWDKGDVVPVADFMTDDFFIALTHQLREHGYAEQKSEVVNLTTKLLGITQEGSEYVAVVAFEGAMKINGEFEEVHERWLLVQAIDGSTGWLLAGLEQM